MPRRKKQKFPSSAVQFSATTTACIAAQRFPTAFWKVISFVSNGGRPSATAYTIDQVQELKDLEAQFGAFKTYQRSVHSIGKLAGLSFGELVGYDGFSNEEIRTRTAIVAEVRGPSDMRF